MEEVCVGLIILCVIVFLASNLSARSSMQALSRCGLYHMSFCYHPCTMVWYNGYGPRNGAPPNVYPSMGPKPLPSLVNMPLPNEPPPGYRGRYDGPPFEDIPPGVEPPVPGFEPSPFDKQPFGLPGPMDRDRLPPPNYRDPYRPPPYVEGPAGYRDMPIPPLQNEIPVHVGDHPQRFRDNFRPGHSFRDHGPVSYRDGPPYRDQGPQQPPYRDPRDPNFRGGPPPFRDNSYRNMSYREGNFRDNPPHNFRDTGVPFRAPSTDPRDPQPVPYHDPNFREAYRDENGSGRDNSRSGYRSSVRSKGGSRRNPTGEHERHRERDGRDRERLNENPLERIDKPRERSGHDKTREVRDDRPREYDRSRDYEKERTQDKTTPDKKVRMSPKRTRDVREKKRSESRGRSRDRERDSRRDKKEDKTREKSSDRSREHKEKDKKLKDRKKKKREKEKEKDVDKKKKREKKEKKNEKEPVKKDNDTDNQEVSKDIKEENISEETVVVKEETEKIVNPNVIIKTEEKAEIANKENDTKTDIVNKVSDLYGDEAAEAVDKEIIQNYVKSETNEQSDTKPADTSKEEPFDGIELQAATDDLEADIEGNNHKEMLAPLPELSKWEVDEENVEKAKEPGEITSPEEEEEGKVTTEVLKRAENAIFAKAINSLRPIEIKKISSDRVKLYGDETQTKNTMSNIQITVPVTDTEQRSVEVNERKRRHSKTPPPRLSVKDRLGGKVEDIRRPREHRVVQSTVERVKSRSKTPKREQVPYRRVTVERDRGRKAETTGRNEVAKSDRRVLTEEYKVSENYRGVNPTERKRDSDKNSREDKKNYGDDKLESRPRGHDKTTDQNRNAERERKKSTLDEANFEPDYDETVESDNEPKEDVNKKRDRSGSPHSAMDSKKPKIDNETIKLDLTNVKKKPETDSESSSDTEYSSSSSSSDARKKKRKKKRARKKKKRAASDSDSDSGSSSDDHKKKKKKRKHKKKSSKKKKKSKHK